MAKRHIAWGNRAIERFVKKSLNAIQKQLAKTGLLHVRLMKGNDKTGLFCFTVSLLPVIDCPNCSECKNHCYDVQHDCINKGCFEQRVINHIIHKADAERYWREIELQVQANFVTQLRINVGGDLSGIDFECINEMAKRNPGCDFLFFTKNYKECNSWLAAHNGEFEGNVKCIFSRWPGMECDNPFNMPESHVLWEDGSTTAPEFGAYYCGGNCSECHFKQEGCWVLKKGEHVIFRVH